MAKENSASGLASSLTDLMTSLAVIFILLFVAQLSYYGHKGEEVRDTILARLRKQLEEFQSSGVRVDTDPKDPLGLLIILPEQLLKFAVDKADIPPGGVDFLKVFIPQLAERVCAEDLRREISLIVIEGHADSTGTDSHNLDLSQRRSMNVSRVALELLNGSTKDCFRDYLSASGRGRAEPVLSKLPFEVVSGGYLIRSNPVLANHEEDLRSLGSEDRPSSRRVVFKVRVRSLEQRRLIEVVSSPSGKK